MSDFNVEEYKGLKIQSMYLLFTIKDLIVEDKQGIEQVLKADNCQKHTSFADNFIFFRISY